MDNIKIKLAGLILIMAVCITITNTGCQVVSNAQKRLQRYCPGLAIKLDSVNMSGATAADGSGRETYILGYDEHDEALVENYFFKGNRGFARNAGNNFFEKGLGDDKFIGNDDNAVGKTIKTGKKKYAVVMFDETKRTIIILEYY